MENLANRDQGYQRNMQSVTGFVWIWMTAKTGKMIQMQTCLSFGLFFWHARAHELDENVDLLEMDGADNDVQDRDVEKGARDEAILPSPGLWEKKMTSPQDFIIDRITDLIALKADAVFTSFNLFFNLAVSF